jgi:hypothetical protein
MQRYTKSLALLNAALNLMMDEGDTLMIASLAHPLHQIEERLTLCRAGVLKTHFEPTTNLRPSS